MSSSIRKVSRVLAAAKLLEGGGFPVRRPVPGNILGEQFDPFLLIDHMGPIFNEPHEAVLAPDHPHKGFETVTYLLEGSVDHLDSFNHSGTIKAGGVQWMKAGRGLIHSEMPSKELLSNGGNLEGFQIWVNLPAKFKNDSPSYQELDPEQIPIAKSDDGKVSVKIISGTSLGVSAKIDTVIPIYFLDVRMEKEANFEQIIPEDLNCLIYCFRGSASIGEEKKIVNEGEAAVMKIEKNKEKLVFTTDHKSDARFLILAGQPLNEPIARAGPFVMNHQHEIRAAFMEYQNGEMGFLQGSEERMKITADAKRIKAERLRKEKQSPAKQEW